MASGAITAQSLEVISALESASTRRELRAGDVIVTEGAPASGVFMLVSGSARAFVTSAGGQQLSVKLLKAPTLFGEVECLTGSGSLVSVEALETAVVLRTPRAVFLCAMERSAALTRNV